MLRFRFSSLLLALSLAASAADQHVKTDVDGTTPLHWAVYEDDAQAVTSLLGAGANVKAANRYGVTPLSLACTNGNGPIVRLLLNAGANPNDVLSGGETAENFGDCAPYGFLRCGQQDWWPFTPAGVPLG